MRITDRIIDEMEPILERVAFGEKIDYDVTVQLLPPQTPTGPAMVVAQFFFFLRPPVLGAGDLCIMQMMPIEATKDAHNMEGMLRATVEQLRQQSADMLRMPPGAQN